MTLDTLPLQEPSTALSQETIGVFFPVNKMENNKEARKILSHEQQGVIRQMAKDINKTAEILSNDPTLAQNLLIYLRHAELNTQHLYQRRYPDQALSFEDFVARNPLYQRIQKLKKLIQDLGLTSSDEQNQTLEKEIVERKERLDFVMQDGAQIASGESIGMPVSEVDAIERSQRETLDRQHKGDLDQSSSSTKLSLSQLLSDAGAVNVEAPENKEKEAAIFKHLDVMELEGAKASQTIQLPEHKQPRGRKRLFRQLMREMKKGVLPTKLYANAENDNMWEHFFHSLDEQNQEVIFVFEPGPQGCAGCDNQKKIIKEYMNNNPDAMMITIDTSHQTMDHRQKEMRDTGRLIQGHFGAREFTGYPVIAHLNNGSLDTDYSREAVK